MQNEPARPPVWIHNTAHLQEVCRELQEHPRLAVDTESNSLFSYQEKVCLIQISSPIADYLIDPLEKIDLQPLGTCFVTLNRKRSFTLLNTTSSASSVITIFFSNIFDTMIAARILGHTHVGLDSLLEKYFGVVLNKKYQRANWGIRPLPKEMLDYARLDTYYLFDLRNALEVDLVEKGLLDLGVMKILSPPAVPARKTTAITSVIAGKWPEQNRWMVMRQPS
jgi:ribonuclease D